MVRRGETRQRAKPPAYEAVRRLERVEQGSIFFYEVSRQAKWVMVRSGRVNLPGQTRMREYPTPPAASVAMERLIEDRLKEGWMDPEALQAELARKAEEQARAGEEAQPPAPRRRGARRTAPKKPRARR